MGDGGGCGGGRDDGPGDLEILPVSAGACNSVLAEAIAGSVGFSVSLEGDAAEVGAGLVAMVAAGL